MYARIETGHAVEYPFDYRAAFPNTVFSVPLSPELAASFGFAEVKLAPQPTFDALTHKVVETTPALVCGQWVQQWEMAPLTEAELDAVRAGLSITPRQARLALLGAGLLDTVQGAFAQLPEPHRTAAQIEWEYATSIERNSPLVSQFGPLLGLTEAQIDDLFTQAAAL